MTVLKWLRTSQAYEARSALFRFFENVGDIVALYDLTGAVEFMSSSITAILGYEQDELVGGSALYLVHDEDQGRLRGAWRAAIVGKTGPGAVPVEYRVLAKDGRLVWLESHPVAQRDEASGRAVRIQDVLRDITRRKAVETELLLAKDAACASAADTIHFLANMSHEIRTPLTGVIGFSDRLNRIDGLPEPARHFAQRISISSQALLCVVNDILDLTKLDAGRLELDPRSFDPRAFLDETLDLVLAQADAKGLELTLQCAAELPRYVRADRNRLRQVLMNLLTNAIKFTPAGGVSVAADFSDDRLHVTVTDTGPGIAEDQRDRLFQRFSQIGPSTTRVHGGSGLGLAICKNLVGLMDGGIGVRPNEGGGSVFWFSIAAPASSLEEEQVSPR